MGARGIFFFIVRQLDEAEVAFPRLQPPDYVNRANIHGSCSGQLGSVAMTTSSSHVAGV